PMAVQRTWDEKKSRSVCQDRSQARRGIPIIEAPRPLTAWQRVVPQSARPPADVPRRSARTPPVRDALEPSLLIDCLLPGLGFPHHPDHLYGTPAAVGRPRACKAASAAVFRIFGAAVSERRKSSRA